MSKVPETRMQIYSLDKAEREAVENLRKQFTDTQEDIKRLEEALAQRRSQLVAIQGAVNGMGYLLSAQHLPEGTKAFKFDTDFATVSVTTEPESA